MNDNCQVAAVTRSATRADEFRQAGLHPLLLDLAAPGNDCEIPAADVVLWAVGFDRTAGVPREKVWIDGLQWLVRSLPEPPRRFIYISSTSVYGASKGETVNESTPPNPSTDGGQFCVQAEQLLRAECRQRFPDTQVIVLRMAGIYGPNRLLRRVADLRQQTPLPGAPDHWLNLIHVEDAVRAVQYAAVSESVPGIINVMNTRSVTRGQYYARLAELTSVPAPVFGSDTSSGRQRGGHKRVVSIYANPHADFEFNDVLQGLDDAWQKTPSPK